MVQITAVEPKISELPRKIIAGTASDSDAITQDALPQDGSLSKGGSGSSLPGPSGFDDSNLGPPPVESIPEPPSPLWESEATRKKRQVALIATISGCGLLIAALTFTWFVKNWSTNETVADKAPVDEVATTDSQTTELADTGKGSEDVVTATVPSLEKLENLTTDAPDSKTPAETASAPAMVESASQSQAVPPTSLVEPWRVDGAETSPGNIAPVIPRTDAEEPEAVTGVDQGKMMELPPGLAEFIPLMDLEASNFDLQPTLKTPQTINEVQVKAPAQEFIDPMMIANPPEPIELDIALAIQMTFDSQGTPLTEFSLFMSQVTGVPIHLDWTSFDIAGQNIDQAIEIPKGWMSAADVLDAIAKNLNSEARREKSMIVFTLSDEAFDAAQNSVVSLGDFGDGASTAGKLLVEFLRLPGDEEPQTRLAGIQTREDKQLAAFAADSLRRMRGIEPKISDERFQRWASMAKVTSGKDPAESTTGQWPPVSGLNSVEQLIAPETVASVLRMTAKANDAACLINAYDMRRRGLSPEQLVMPYSGQSGEVMLEKMLAPFRMQVRQVDETHWWVGTAATYDRLPVLVWTEPLGALRADLIARFAMIAENDLGSEFRLVIDEASDRAFMLLPRFIAKQINQLLPTAAVP